MPTPILSCAADRLDSSLARAIEVLRAGGLVAFPTETVYGLGANALDADAVRRIFAAKGRPATNPVIVHVATIEQVALVASDWPDDAARLAAAFWPGPLTLVLPRRPDVPDVVTAGGPTVAVRIPSHPVAHRLLEVLGLPIAAPSANRSNHLSPTTAQHVFADLNGRIDLLLDGGPTSGGIESTVVDVTIRPARLLRPGLIDPREIERILGPITRTIATSSAPLPSPGMLSRHYAPRTPLECVEGDATDRLAELLTAGLRVALVTHRPNFKGVRVVTMPADPAGYAARLYEALHLLDAEGFDRLIVELPPDEDAWLAVRDRLCRASS